MAAISNLSSAALALALAGCAGAPAGPVALTEVEITAAYGADTAADRTYRRSVPVAVRRDALGLSRGQLAALVADEMPSNGGERTFAFVALGPADPERRTPAGW